jgi:CBS-domain-containing membrane protein|tara:strand:+ start:2847 stop:3362 length:516 start_codon:yes stop_codon:yes gene_type:complete
MLAKNALVMYANKMKINLLSAFGAFLCITALAYLNGLQGGSLWLIPPFGASMVLVMAVHESPLAHPKNILFGHIFSALSGVLVYMLFGYSPVSIGIAVALAIFVMMTTKTVHPPAGANPIIAVVGAKGLTFVLMPVAIGASFIVLFAIIYNRLLKRKYFTFKDWNQLLNSK